MGDVRIDTVGVAFPENVDDFREGTFRRGQRVRLSGGGFVATGVGGMAWAEASLPNRQKRHNVEGLTLEESHDAIRDLVAEACEVLAVDKFEVQEIDEDGVLTNISVENPKIVRLDLVRDFQLSKPARLGCLLDGLASLPQGGKSKVQRFSDGKSGFAETLRVGPGAWAATLYDKHAESGGLADPGRLRAEFRLRGRQLRSARVNKLAGSLVSQQDLSEERCEAIRRAWWDRVGFGSWVGGKQSVWDALGVSGLSDREKVFFAGWYSARESGHRLEISDKTERKCRAILAELELGGDGGERLRLNYELGVEEAVECRD